MKTFLVLWGFGLAACGVDHAEKTNLIPAAPSDSVGCATKTYDADVIQWTKASSFVFRGTVTRLNATTEPSVPPDGLFVVHVDHMLWGNDFSAGFVGKEVTIKPPGALDIVVGTDAFFFTTSLIDGTGIVVTEVGRADPSARPSIETDVPEIEDLLTARALYDDLMAADLVAVGHVGYVGTPVGSAGSEHDPRWADANIFLAKTLRDTRTTSASPSANVAVLRFASSDDVAWYSSPKLTVNELGIFIAHDDAAGARTTPGNFDGVVYRPSLDVRDQTDEPYLEDLLRCPPPAL
jgi:hypothetical protein